MPMPNRADLIAYWQNPANITPYAQAGGYDLEMPSNLAWWINTAPASTQVSISKNSTNDPVIFIWGPAGSFTGVPTSSFLVHNTYTISSGPPVDGLRVSMTEWWRAAMLIEEIGRGIDANPTTFDIPDVVTLIVTRIGSLIPRGAMLSKNEIKGLYGELILFERLVNLATANGISHQAVLDAWKGHITPTPNSPYGARRDFTRLGVNPVIEVKTTGADTRMHKINNHLQLIEDVPPEHLYLFSVAAKNDATGNDSLPAIVERICGLLAGGHRATFEGYIGNYSGVGYRRSEGALYNRDSELLLTTQFAPELFDLRAVDYFTGEAAQFAGPPPVHSSGYQYTLDLTTVAPVANTNAILLTLIQ